MLWQGSAQEISFDWAEEILHLFHVTFLWFYLSLKVFTFVDVSHFLII